MMPPRANKKNSVIVSATTKMQHTTLPSFTFAKYTVTSALHPNGNEDYILADQRRGLAAVFDGVGGSAAGDVASQLAAKVVRRGWKRFLQQQGTRAPGILASYSAADLRSILQQLLMDAQEQIHAERARRVKAKKISETEYLETTVVLAAFSQQSEEHSYTMAYASAGDSRIYLLRTGEQLRRLTVDDGWLTKKVRENVVSEADALRIDQATRRDELTDEEWSHFEKRNGITQALGDAKSPDIHTGDIVISSGDRVLLCSDGVHDNLTDQVIETIMRDGKRTTVAKALVQQAIECSHQANNSSIRAKADDMSALVITCNQSGMSS